MTRKRLSQTTTRNKKTDELPPNVSRDFKTLSDGTSKEYWTVRLWVRSVGGKYKAVSAGCKVGSRTDAADVLKKLKAQYANKTAKQIENDKRTFGELADEYERTHLVQANVTREGHREEGLARVDTPRRYLNGHAKLTEKELKRCYGPDLGLRTLVGETTKLIDIDGRFVADVRKQIARAKTVKLKWFPKNGKKRGERRKIYGDRGLVDINRRMEIFRHMINVARKDLEWIDQTKYANPFTSSTTSLIPRRKEKPRDRVMEYWEEDLILKFAEGPRAHLAVIIPGLVDSCVRSTEFFKLKVSDWRHQRLLIQSTTAKSRTERTTQVSSRFEGLIERWIEDNDLGRDDYLFNLKTIRAVCGDNGIEENADELHLKSIRKAWDTCKRLTGVKELQDITIKDLRRTGATRLYNAGVPMATIQKILGHTTIEMTIKYLAIKDHNLEDVRNTMDAVHAKEFGKLYAAKEATQAIN
jgi:integrase